MPARTHAALSIAGFDPSAGAGVLADIKTFEATGSYGFGAVSCLTWQTENAFHGWRGLPIEDIVAQVGPLLRQYEIAAVKIGLMPDFACLYKTILHLREHLPQAFVCWDPVIKASAGFMFHETIEKETLAAILGKVDLATPNQHEYQWLIDHAGASSLPCAVLLKGGHAEGPQAEDVLLLPDGSQTLFNAPRIEGSAKHGSGCVLSAAVASYVAQGFSLPDAVQQAKEYTSRFLTSSPTLLGRHRHA